jgi:hypothetical protein
MHDERELSPLAQQRMAAMLPQLVGAVRWRRRRRRAVQGALVAAVVWLGVALWPDGTAGPQPSDPGPVQRVPICEVVHDVPDVLAKYRVEPVRRADWFVDDDELQQFLNEGQRPSGLVRVGARVTVVRSAIDPFPKGEAE